MSLHTPFFSLLGFSQNSLSLFQNKRAHFLLRKKPGFPLQFLGCANAHPAGFPLQSHCAPRAGHDFARQNRCSPMHPGLVTILQGKIVARPCILGFWEGPIYCFIPQALSG
jgi:hypothetical protein